jgi:septal ring factor EnvC (AmiA/AmiB activator)
MVIRRYNEHIDKCNRVIEAQEVGLPSAGAANTEVESLRRQLEEARTECDAATRERDKLQAELKQTSATVADLSLRLSGSTSKGNGHSQEASPGTDASNSELMQHINRLQQQLYAEREKNKRLKGG